MFTIVKDFVNFLDLVLANIDVNVETRNFEDIHKEYNTKHVDMEALKNEVVISENYLPSLKPIPDKEDSEPILSAEFYQFDEETTKNLVQNCRQHNATVQGAVSIATLVGLLYTHKTDVSNSRVKCINSVPCNMRGLIEPKLSSEDCVCGSAALIWAQDVKGDDALWTLVTNATKNIHELRDTGYGLKWWMKIVNSLPMQQYSIMSSSIGLIDLKEQSLKKITLNDVRMMGGSYKLMKNNAGNMTHVFTSLNRLTVVMSYTYPALSKEWARKFACIQSLVLNYFANKDTGMTLKSILDEFESKLN